MRRVLLLLIVLAPLFGDEEPPDAFAAALDAMNVAEHDLGYRPRAHWARYPHPRTVPYVLPFFADLHARPLDTYAFTRGLGNVVEDLLTPEKLAEAPTEKDRAETLFKLGVALATDRRIGGFRGYSCNLNPRPLPKAPLFHALRTLRARAGAPLDAGGGSFGGRFASGDDAPHEKLAKQIEAIPSTLRAPLARYVLNLIDARTWIDRGLRKIPVELRRKVFATLDDLTESSTDGTRYHAVIDEVAALVDEHSLWYGCLKALQATQDARRELHAVKPDGGWPEFDVRLESPWGVVRFCSDIAGPDAHGEDLFLLVSFAHQGVFWGPVGATAPERPLSVALFVENGGNVGQSVGTNPRDGETAAVASGVLGCGIVYTSGADDNAYRANRWGLGAGLFGLGALVDEGGRDSYKMAAVGQGAGLFGAGLLLDAAGDDTYTLLEGDGQGFGGPNGIGVLADRSGDDAYYAEPDAKKAGRADYHSDDKVAANNAQGVGAGRRGDGSDGHVWAGGLGALIDVDGNDTYRAGNFTQGLGYWYGTGLLWDGGGNDEYRSVYFTQGSGAHFAIGALIDEGGDDIHVLDENAGAAFGFGWDVVNAFLIDRGDGKDRYEARIISTGMAEIRSNAFFVDEGGDDVYVLQEKAKGFGDVDTRPYYTTPRRTSRSMFDLAQVAVFLDLGGTDRYLRRPRKGDGAPVPDPDARDGAVWHVRSRDPAARHGPNVSYAADLARGRLGFLDAWPRRSAEKK